MKLNHDTCYRALQARDARFDGQFFTGVKTTGIFCRPVCPAPTPRAENCVFLPSAAAAQEAGFRPCLRCRPEISPQLTLALEGGALVQRAMRLIAGGALDEGSVGDLAGRLDITERHLRRLFIQHLGATPTTVAQTRRVLFAKQLLDETGLPVTEIAFAAGFSSLRRFNAVIQQTYRRAPGELRRQRPANDGQTARSSGISLKLAYSQPYNWPALRDFLAYRAIPGVETVDEAGYRRTISLDGRHGLVRVQPVAGQNYLLATINFPKIGALAGIVERLRRMFDLSANTTEITAQLGSDPLLGPLVAARPGLRVPGAWDRLEVAVRAILGQQVSVAAARTLAGRLAAAYGRPLELEGSQPDPHLRYVFPEPSALAEADLAADGLTRARAQAVRTLAATVARDPRFLEDFENLDQAVRRLRSLPGLGEWTAQYIALRALGEPDAFPAADLGLLKAAGGSGPRLTPAQLLKQAEAWRPWRAYAAIYLWSSLATTPATNQE